MTNADTLGYFTVRHLDQWLAANVAEGDETFFGNERDRLRELMLQKAADNIDWLDRGWWRVYDAVRS